MDNSANRFWLFAGSHYYPSGGMGDFVGRFETVQDALQAIPHGSDWYEIVNVLAAEVVVKGSC